MWGKKKKAGKSLLSWEGGGGGFRTLRGQGEKNKGGEVEGAAKTGKWGGATRKSGGGSQKKDKETIKGRPGKLCGWFTRGLKWNLYRGSPGGGKENSASKRGSTPKKTRTKRNHSPINTSQRRKNTSTAGRGTRGGQYQSWKEPIH